MSSEAKAAVQARGESASGETNGTACEATTSADASPSYSENSLSSDSKELANSVGSRLDG